jgi:hypothetical protein
MVSDERLKLLVIAHEEERHELARTPSVNVCSRHRRAGAKVFAIFWRLFLETVLINSRLKGVEFNFRHLD